MLKRDIAVDQLIFNILHLIRFVFRRREDVEKLYIVFCACLCGIITRKLSCAFDKIFERFSAF